MGSLEKQKPAQGGLRSWKDDFFKQEPVDPTLYSSSWDDIKFSVGFFGLFVVLPVGLLVLLVYVLAEFF